MRLKKKRCHNLKSYDNGNTPQSHMPPVVPHLNGKEMTHHRYHGPAMAKEMCQTGEDLKEEFIQYQWPSYSVLHLTRMMFRRVHLPQLKMQVGKEAIFIRSHIHIPPPTLSKPTLYLFQTNPIGLRLAVFPEIKLVEQRFGKGTMATFSK